MTLLELFWSFLKIGFTSFGGLSMIPLISSEMIGHGWMNATEVTDIVAIAEMTPGPVGLNCATFAGIRVAGILGALAANFGMLVPTFTVCAAAGVFFERFNKSRVMGDVMTVVRPVCVGLIWAVVVSLGMTNYIVDGAVKVTGVEPASLHAGPFRRFSPCRRCLASARLSPPLRKSLENSSAWSAKQFLASGFVFGQGKARREYSLVLPRVLTPHGRKSAVRNRRGFDSRHLNITGVLIGLLGVYLLLGRKWSVPMVIGVAALLGIIFCR